MAAYHLRKPVQSLMCHPVGHKDQTIIRRGANLSEQRTGERQREEGVNGLANRNTSLLSQRRQSRVTVVDPDGLSCNFGTFRYHADVDNHATLGKMFCKRFPESVTVQG